MSEFHVAIPEAVTHVQPMVQALEEAQRECREATSHVQALRERLNAERQALEAAVKDLHHDTDQIAEFVAGHVADAVANLGRGQEVLELAASDWKQAAEAEDHALEQASALLPPMTAAVKEMGEKAHDACHNVLDWANRAAEHLEKSVAAMEEVVGTGLVKVMSDWKHQAEAEVQRLLEFLDKQCAHLLEEKEGEWKEKMPKAHEVVDHAFEAIEKHIQEVAGYTAEQWDHLLKGELDAAQQEAVALEDTLSSLGREVREEWDTELHSATKNVSDHQEQVSNRAGRLEHALQELREHWATQGVTC